MCSVCLYDCIYIVDECKKIDSKAEKMSYVASKWQSLSNSEHVMWQNEAKQLQKTKPSMLTQEEKKKQIAKGKKNLLKEVCVLFCLTSLDVG